MQVQIAQWLKEDEIHVFLGYKRIEGHLLPYCFTRDNMEELTDLVVSPDIYPLEKTATRLAARHPELKIGILLARDSNQRTLNVLYVWNQLNPDNVKTLEASGDSAGLKDGTPSSALEPQAAGGNKKQVGIDNSMQIEAAEAYDQQQRFSRWMYEFEKCIKCYGCRNICPVCFCKECSLEHAELIKPGSLPPEIPIFHLVRAVHMAGRCIDCGLCEEACPADIPLRLLYRKVNQIVKDVFDYENGVSAGQSPFSLLGDKVTLEPNTLHANPADTDGPGAAGRRETGNDR